VIIDSLRRSACRDDQKKGLRVGAVATKPPTPHCEDAALSIHVLTGHGAPAVPKPGEHLPTQRPRTYRSDTTGAEWQILGPLVPIGGTQPGRGGRPGSYPRRDIVDAIRYVARTGDTATPAGTDSTTALATWSEVSATAVWMGSDVGHSAPVVGFGRHQDPPVGPAGELNCLAIHAAARSGHRQA